MFSLVGIVCWEALPPIRPQGSRAGTRVTGLPRFEPCQTGRCDGQKLGAVAKNEELHSAAIYDGDNKSKLQLGLILCRFS